VKLELLVCADEYPPARGVNAAYLGGLIGWLIQFGDSHDAYIYQVRTSQPISWFDYVKEEQRTDENKRGNLFVVEYKPK